MKNFWQSSWFGRKMMLSGSFSGGHTPVFHSQSDSSLLTHRSWDREKNKPGLHDCSTAAPEKHKKYDEHERGLGIFEMPVDEHSVGTGADVVVMTAVVVVITVVVVGGKVGGVGVAPISQSTFCGESQACKG
jgi:hypothetical protein